MALDGPQEGEHVLEIQGLPLAVDPRLLAVLGSVLVDHVDGAFGIRAELPPLVQEFGLPTG